MPLSIKIRILFAAILLCCASHTPVEADNHWFTSIYVGKFTDTPLLDIFRFDTDLKDSHVYVLSVGKQVGMLGQHIAVEVEGQVAKHDGLQDHEELNAAFNLRWLPFPWDHILDTSFAMGNGLSYATQDPPLEIEDSDDNRTSPWLYYISVEFAISPAALPSWDLFARVHHRSSVFGTIEGLNAGSNFVGLGLRYRFRPYR